jgi:hypothetical protein
MLKPIDHIEHIFPEGLYRRCPKVMNWYASRGNTCEYPFQISLEEQESVRHVSAQQAGECTFPVPGRSQPRIGDCGTPARYTMILSRTLDAAERHFG